MKVFLLFLSLLKLSWAGKAAYLGGDIDQYVALSKKSQLYPKAAIQAVQARAVIAQKRLHNYKKSNIPHKFKSPLPNLVTVPGAEKSSIPHPEELLKFAKRSLDGKDGFHRGIPSILLSEEKRSEISKLNAAALHRNANMDNMGGLSYGGMGGVLSRQRWRFTKKHRRSVDDEANRLSRKRRSHMPYLGQNLDRLGVVRVQPNWEEQPTVKKDSLPKPEVPEVKAPEPAKVNEFLRQSIPVPQANVQQALSPSSWNPWQQRSQIPVNPFSQFQGQMAFQNPYGSYAQPFAAAASNKLENNRMNKQLSRSKKSIEDVTARHQHPAQRPRRSYTPYFGQDADRLFSIRVKPDLNTQAIAKPFSRFPAFPSFEKIDQALQPARAVSPFIPQPVQYPSVLPSQPPMMNAFMRQDIPSKAALAAAAARTRQLVAMETQKRNYLMARAAEAQKQKALAAAAAQKRKLQLENAARSRQIMTITQRSNLWNQWPQTQQRTHIPNPFYPYLDPIAYQSRPVSYEFPPSPTANDVIEAPKKITDADLK